MKLVSISDTHNKHIRIEVPEADVVIHAGDATLRGAVEETAQFLNWYQNLPHKYKIFVAGNHDRMFERQNGLAKQLCQDRGIIYLENSSIEIEGYNFFGSPITPEFQSWAFNVERFAPIKRYWDMIPDNTDVLITHGPPYGILDEVLAVDGMSYSFHGQAPRHVGCEELLEAVKRVKPDVHIFGHIHCGYGQKHIDGTSFYNSSMCDEMYMPTNAPHVIELF